MYYLCKGDMYLLISQEHAETISQCSKKKDENIHNVPW